MIPLQLNTTRTWAVVYVSGVQNPKADDWIGLFSLPDDVSTIDARNHAPVKFKVNLLSLIALEGGFTVHSNFT